MTVVEFLEYVRAAGALTAPVFALLYWFERDERKDAQKELKDIAVETAVALNELKMMVSNLSSIFDRDNRGRRER